MRFSQHIGPWARQLWTMPEATPEPGPGAAVHSPEQTLPILSGEQAVSLGAVLPT